MTLRSARAVSGEVLSSRVRGMVPAELVIPAGQAFAIALVEDDAVPADHRALVRGYVDAAGQRLGLGRVHVRYYRPAEGDELPLYVFDGKDTTQRCLLGITPPPSILPDTVILPAELRGDALLAVVAHEVRHVHQYRQLERIRGAINARIAAYNRLADEINALSARLDALASEDAMEGDADRWMGGYVTDTLA